MRTLLPGLLLLSACGGSPFESAADVIHPDAQAQEAAAEASGDQDGQPGPEAGADAREAGVDAPTGHDGGTVGAESGMDAGSTCGDAGGSCVNVPSGWALVEVSFQGVGCDGAYQGGTSTLSTDPDGGMVVYTCVPLSAPACATGVCAPAVGTGLRLCVSQANDVACPNGYTERSVEYAAGSVATTLCCL